MSTRDPAAATLALERWLDALRGFGASEPVVAAMADDAEVLRFGWDDRRGVLGERFRGHDEIAAWCGRSPREVRFDLAEPPVPGPDDTWIARYRISLGDFRNHGNWQLRLADDGRIARLEHQPEDLPQEWRDGVPEGMRLPGMETTRAELEAAAQAYAADPERHRAIATGEHGHDHDHEHDHGSDEG